MATAGSSGLNNLLSNTVQSCTTLPCWYNSAQQNILNNANTAQTAAPQFQNTTAQNAVNTLSGANNPFSQAEGSLSHIAAGAANPWITCATTGAVTPNTATAMGGLFKAECQQLNQILPQAVAPVEAGNIGSGNFGSLRGQTAMDSARANAFDTLAAQQMQSALTNQQTGVSAGNALANTGTQCVQANLTAGTAQMNAPYQNVGNYANIVNSLQVPTTAKTQTQLSPLNMIGAIGTAGTGAVGAACSLLKTLGYSGGLAGLLKGCCAGNKLVCGSGSNNSVGVGGQQTTNTGGTTANLTGTSQGNGSAYSCGCV